MGEAEGADYVNVPRFIYSLVKAEDTFNFLPWKSASKIILYTHFLIKDSAQF